MVRSLRGTVLRRLLLLPLRYVSVLPVPSCHVQALKGLKILLHDGGTWSRGELLIVQHLGVLKYGKSLPLSISGHFHLAR
jgi:hypothetical protein